MKIKELNTIDQRRFDNCCEELATVIKANLPEIIQSWERKDPGTFMTRVEMTLYLEMIHAGFFNTKSINE